MHVFITGATGLIGRRLVRALLDRSDTPISLSRKQPTNPVGEVIVGDPSTAGPWVERMRTCDAVVHLAGAGIFDRRWSKSYIQTLRDSRVNSTRTIVEALNGSAVKTFISGSAVGIYGDRGDETLTESASPGTDFLADLCREWEAAADPIRDRLRVCHPRTSIVLDPDGGALPTMTLPYRMFVGGRIGSGKQYVSWIHHADMTRLLLFALDTPHLVGPFNACSPNPATNDEMGRLIGKVLRRPHWLPAPGFAVRIGLGKVADAVLGGQRAILTAATNAGFTFRFAELEAALRDVLR